MTNRPLTDRDRAFLDRHKKLGAEDDRPVRGSSELVEISGNEQRRTGKALCWFDGTREAWIPISQITENDDGTISIPEWLAKRAGFI